MKIANGHIRLTASDLSNHLACRHVTTLDLEVVLKGREEPARTDPDLAIILERAARFEKSYLEYLAAQGSRVESLAHISFMDEQRLLSETAVMMERGVDVIAQGALGDEKWLGRIDVLKRVDKPGKWPWSYEVADTKLARETKATTILQLSLYSELLGKAQGVEPEWFYVVTPAGGKFAKEEYRVAEYAFYYQYVKQRLAGVVKRAAPERERKAADAGQYALAFERTEETGWETYPEPVQHCDVCRWFRECNEKRRADDHLSFVAGIRRQQRDQFEEWNASTMAKLAVLPTPLQQKPRHGSRDAYENVQKQARIQVEARENNALKHTLLDIVEGMGLCRLPEPSAGDMFVDLEGDPFVGEQGLRYLFGFVAKEGAGELRYEKRWALDAASEKEGFEWLVDEIMRRREADSKMHVYHFGAYEPTAFKGLMGLHTTREDEIDRMLRAGVLVDLHLAFKQGVRASVEEYSLKKIEAFYGFKRNIRPEDSRAAMRYVEHGLELDRMDHDIPEAFRLAMETYNADDCLSTARLRDWLEGERKKLVEGGTPVARFIDRDEKPSADVAEQQKRTEELVHELTKDIPKARSERTAEQQAQWLLAQLLDWHRRDAKPKAWRYFELRAMDDADLLEEKDAVAGLSFTGTVMLEDGSPADRYSFPAQETSIRADDKKEAHYRLQRIGTVAGIDPVARYIDIKKSSEAIRVHPTSIFVKEPYRNPKAQQDSLYRLGCWVRDNGIETHGPRQGLRDYLCRRAPRLTKSEKLEVSEFEEFGDELARIVSAMDASVLAVQGPPGSGKTTNAAHAIGALVRKRRLRIGVTALSHSVIRHLLRTIVTEVSSSIRCMHKSDGKDDGGVEGISITRSNEVARKALQQRTVDVLGGTAFLWSREEFANSVDVLFVDEASQVSLADLAAISQAAVNVVLIGDPQQLARPGDASHPPGAELSSLEHILADPEQGELKTMPPNLGLFIQETKRLHPKICDFISKIFYEERLHAREFTRERIVKGHPWVKGAGLWFVPVEHEGSRNSSAEEIDVIARIVKGLQRRGVKWFRGTQRSRQMTKEDILIVAPYNAQVSDLAERLPGMKIGTVDKFQGQEAPVVIYSMTTSSPEEAPRGMEFLYSLNRLNVATSRAMTAVIVIGSPKLFEPECRTPRQMQLANALCAYRKMATEIDARTV
jgi:predicted RecB family nuclease